LSEERFRGAIESMDEVFALFDATEHLDVYNDKFVELHDEIKDIIAPGVTHSEILRAFVSRGVFPEAKGLEEEFIRMRLELRKQKKFDSAIRNLANGKSYIIRENYMDDGGVFVTFSDITKIQQANNRFRALFEQSHLGIFVHQNHKILMANPAAADMYGYDSVEEFVNISSSRQLTRPEYHTHENKKRMKGEQVITEAENIGIKKTAAIFGSANGRF
jgi:PAS domain-containing protein